MAAVPAGRGKSFAGMVAVAADRAAGIAGGKAPAAAGTAVGKVQLMRR